MSEQLINSKKKFGARSKRLVELALKKEVVHTSGKGVESCIMDKKHFHTTENENAFSEECVIEGLEEEDVWDEFNKWKQKQNMNEKVESNHTEKQFIPLTEFIDSSTSWIPDEEESNSTSHSLSDISQEIQIQEALQYQDEDHLQQITNDIENTNMTFGREEQTPAPLSNEISQDIRPKLTILQNIINVGVIGDSEKLVDVSQRKSRIWDKKDRCIYCDRDCTNFSRHLFRNHANEDYVCKIMQLPKGNKKRKQMIDIVRKEGNLSLLDENKIRPVQRETRKYEGGKESSGEAIQFMPCPYCKGIYRLKTLRKHTKICSCHPNDGEKCNVASLGQNLLVFKASRRSFYDRLRLKNEVFPKMHADRASFKGKNDPVVCQYAEDYLRKHRRPHIRNAVSNKIRELGRLLIPLQDIYGFNTLLEVMNTKHYDKVVHAAQIISGYDETAKTFQSPSLAMHMKTILLFACLAAKTLLLKQDPVLPVTDYTEALKNVKNFRLLVDERWKFDMSSLALKDLNEKHGKKPQTLPITSDVIKFREYVVSTAEQSIDLLKENANDLKSFKTLTETILVLTVLLNRKRVGDVQYITLDSYKECTNSRNQEECINVLSESEKLLSAHFKRIVSIGKGSKSIPILFPKNVQTYIEVLLSSREQNQLVPNENPFLFALIGSKDKWMDGSSVLRKYSVLCGAENPKTLTSSRLRKQIATVLQVINLNETEKEQVASFMGHTKKTHEEFYRLPQDVFQTAKIAKLLLMMDKGEGANFKGRTLEEIDIHLDSLDGEDCAKIESDSGSGVKEYVSTAFGITETLLESTLALNTVFSFPVCETQMQ
ncbi:unnamed protein product [Phaedon cochleariae]|uniref:Uncharacterized protein n=1 Tax=Phaedon cochleariae TaxID=80249 RepID=A0A9N9SEH2_PHACE|nr:unnamed protein product [Phaedon cochleariae]